jgi:2-polyprenyl-6-methoxyphenol hydroxylase-like FAD-dependent oxidoreductase
MTTQPAQSTSNPAVLVVGAGPTGLLLAAELHRRGVACRIIDAHKEALHWDRATIVHPRSLEVFESLGLVEPFLATGIKQHMARIHSAGRVLGEIDLRICGSRYGFNVGISEETTETILNGYLEKLGGHVDRGQKLVAVEETPSGLMATIERDGVQEKLNVQWLVGCDGAHSTTRQAMGVELVGSDNTEPWAVFDAAVPTWPYPHQDIFGYLDEILVILTSLPNNRWRIYTRPTSTDSDLVADALITLHRYMPELRFADIANPTRFHCHSKVAERYRVGHMLLAGDAAHVCSPSQGHGMNSGIQDAFNLAWKLALVCQGACGDKMLDSYEAERRPVAKMITTSGEAFEDAQKLTGADRSARDEQMRAVFADAKTKHHESIAEAELDIDYSDSPIVHGDKHPPLSPGQRIPDTIQIEIEGNSRLLHEFAHHAGHTALLIGRSSCDAAQISRLGEAIEDVSDEQLIETIVTVTAHTAAADQLGVNDITLLVIRPDGHVGLRADSNHVDALSHYQSMLFAK